MIEFGHCSAWLFWFFSIFQDVFSFMSTDRHNLRTLVDCFGFVSFQDGEFFNCTKGTSAWFRCERLGNFINLEWYRGVFVLVPHFPKIWAQSCGLTILNISKGGGMVWVPVLECSGSNSKVLHCRFLNSSDCSFIQNVSCQTFTLYWTYGTPSAVTGFSNCIDIVLFINIIFYKFIVMNLNSN
mgnify:CR=1 FL=1